MSGLPGDSKALSALPQDSRSALHAVQREGAVTGLGHILAQHSHPFPTQVIRDRWLVDLAGPDIDCFAITQDERLAGFAATRGSKFLHVGTAVRTWGTGLAGETHGKWQLEGLVA